MANYYTLYIDESGDFGEVTPEKNTDHRPWILSGVLVPAKLEEAEKSLERVLRPIETHYQADLEAYRGKKKSLPVLHLGEIRDHLLQYDRELAYRTSAAIAGEVFRALDKLRPRLHYFTVVNGDKTVVPGHRDGTYLAMLPELVAQVEAALGADQWPNRLRIVVAKRGGRNIKADLKYSVDEIMQCVAVGLASRGLAGLLQGDRLPIQHEFASDKMGIQVADFVANCVSNENKETIAPLVQRLEQTGRLHKFVAFGTYPERKARIAERDGDYALALRWWMGVASPDESELCECLVRAMRRSGADNMRATLDSLIERLWQEYRDQDHFLELYEQLFRLDRALETTIAATSQGEKYIPLLFRLRTFHLSISNRLGNAVEAESLMAAQRQMRTQISATPENLPLILRYDLTYLVTLENQLALDDLSRCAENYRNLINQYEICWRAINGVIAGDGKDNVFFGSRTYLAAETSYWRVQLLKACLQKPKPEEPQELQTITAQLQGMLINPALHADDYGRIRNLLVLSWLKQKDFVQALALAEAGLSDASDPFHVFIAVKAAVEASLYGDDATLKACRRILHYLRQRGSQDAFDATRHPYELIWREWGLLEFLIDKSVPRALSCLTESRKRHRNHSPIYRFLSGLLTLHEEFVKGMPLTPLTTNFQSDDTTCLSMGRVVENLLSVNSDMNMLQASRYVSPY